MEIFDQLKEYIDRNNVWPSRIIDKKNYKVDLRSWMTKQRGDKKNNVLSNQKIDKLDSINFIWDLEIERESEWEKGFYAFVKYVKNRHSKNVPYDFITKDKFELGVWVRYQRKDKKNYRLTKEKIVKLESLGFVWDALDNQWNENYKFLINYFKTNKSTNIPRNLKNKEGVNIGDWAGTQKYLRNNNQLPIKKVKLLDKIGFIWDPLEAEWDKQYKALRDYYKKEKTTFVPRRSSDPNLRKLGLWVGRQRKNFIMNSTALTNKRIKLLKNLGFTWDPIEAEWEIYFKALEEFFNTEKKIEMQLTYKTKDGLRLGRWGGRQWVKYKSNKLEKIKISRLEKLGFIWDPLEEQWNIGFEAYKNYVNSTGFKNVPDKFVDNNKFKLGRWYRSQKDPRRKFSKERRSKMSELGFFD